MGIPDDKLFFAQMRRFWLSRGLGCCCLSVRGSENRSLNLANSNKMPEIDNYEFLEGIFGGGGRSRTYDAADMSRVL